MPTACLERERQRKLPVAIWLTLALSVCVHAIVLADLSFHSQTGNNNYLQTMRIRLDVHQAPVAESRQLQQRKQQVAVAKPRPSRSSLAEHASKPEEEAKQEQQEQVESEVAGRAGRQADNRLRYIETVLRQIESKKYYPTAARRRGIEGRIHVQFTLYERDDIRDVIIAGDSGLLKRVAREALLCSIPFTPLPEGISLPVTIEYVMEFKLD